MAAVLNGPTAELYLYLLLRVKQGFILKRHLCARFVENKLGKSKCMCAQTCLTTVRHVANGEHSGCTSTSTSKEKQEETTNTILKN
jgi:hypothetical protein